MLEWKIRICRISTGALFVTEYITDIWQQGTWFRDLQHTDRFVFSSQSGCRSPLDVSGWSPGWSLRWTAADTRVWCGWTAKPCASGFPGNTPHDTHPSTRTRTPYLRLRLCLHLNRRQTLGSAERGVFVKCLFTLRQTDKQSMFLVHRFSSRIYARLVPHFVAITQDLCMSNIWFCNPVT